ncbi:RNA-guided endonuclease IscB [Aetokthonos hydrillicola Thurmond2011]|jgi:5-methylcytosine-specific restriction endonuclease McrA|uniref:RNA-guided endonuclease IscB n=1 Tax=Aetokthonos hydrillicola Thurmond2011 TaxID=2712845 RepID=A0AAP5M4Y4_9CYAN|nr:RNA-guided endonuclease IscB [Aetokthonos hydrillicola]MBO3459076.1 HNH endonuclease [Aetokthonos hydrillicola CCALA 1050]MBW4584750.1 HNH endonuclease [Aetokthonos hydrillicola CCALA 1050]MDR9895296.1 RNA-guided endonuclease IscB [Aetokthonos hydrillicola Thurmond2011]
MSKILVIDTQLKPLNPIHPAQARQLLRNKKAAIYRHFPFTLILKESRSDVLVEPLRIKIDPGSKTTGFALVNDSTGEVVWAAELQHRGFAIRESLNSRRQLRRGRRNRKTRYRKPPKHEWFRKGNKQPCPKQRRNGWLPPSLMSRVHNIKTWVKRLSKLANITAISQELVRFDTQLMQNPEVKGKEYQQGTLAGYETREYLLEKWSRQCAYCGVKNVPLQIEHIYPRAKGGTNRISNLTLSCEKCNLKKGTQDIKEFLKKDPKRFTEIEAQAKKPLVDTAAVNATRFKIWSTLKTFGLPVETGSGGLTKFNRTTQNLDKTHWIDAACVGKSTPSKLNIKGVQPLLIKATGYGTRQMCGTDKHGFPTRHRSNKQIHFGFTTGDIIKAVVTKGKKIGCYVGRVLCRATGTFDISTRKERVAGISHKYCSPIHKRDGYSYGS